MKPENPSTPSPRSTSAQPNEAPAAALRAPGAPRTRRSKTVTAAASPVPTSASPQAIALRAYELFEARNRQHGYDLEDWLRAETELLSPAAASAPAKRRVARSTARS